MQQIAIYDLDKTILSKPTFTAFLVFAAIQKGRRLLWRVPIWLLALIGYRIGLYGRKPLKQFGIRLFIGKAMTKEEADKMARGFAASVVPSDIQPGAKAAIEKDRAAGCRMVIATAAPEFYARVIAEMLGFDDVIATRHVLLADDAIGNRIDGENCYAGEKLKRLEQWMVEQNLDRSACSIRFYSDHPSDAPTLDFADEGILVGEGAKMQELACKNGWQLTSFKGGADA